MFLINFIIKAIDLYIIIIIIRAVLSWFTVNTYHNPVVLWLYRVTDPFLNGIRRIIPTAGLGIDISPIVAIFILSLVKRIVIGMLHSRGF